VFLSLAKPFIDNNNNAKSPENSLSTLCFTKLLF